MRKIIIAAALAGLGLLAIYAGVSAWVDLGDVAISGPGWAAIAGGALLSLVVGGGLMALVFHSSRSGQDERSQEKQLSDDPAP